MPLLALSQLDPCEGLEEQTVEMRHPNSRAVDVCVVTTADPANLAFISHRKPKRLREIVIDTIAPCPCIDERTNAFHRQIGPTVSRLSTLQSNIHF